MKLYLTNGKSITIFNLSDKSAGSVSFDYRFNNEKIPVVLEKREDTWYLKTNDYVKFINDNMIVESMPVALYNHYYFSINNCTQIFTIYILPTEEEEVYDLMCESIPNITIGSAQTSNIYYPDPLVNDTHCNIVKEQGVSKIIAANERSVIYVNNQRVTSSILKTGDVIFIHGLKIIWMNSFIRINNPQKKVRIQGFQFYSNDNLTNTNYEDENEIDDVVLYKPEEYYSPKFRVSNQMQQEVVEIDAPPNSQIQEDLPFILQLGGSITMMTSAFTMGFMVINNLQSGKSTVFQLLPQIVMLVGLLLGSLLFPKLTRRYQKKLSEKREKLRISKYNKYLLKKEQQIDKLIKEQEQTLKDNNLSVLDCYQIMTQIDKVNNINFWSRGVKDNYFLNIRLGIGRMPSSVDVRAPEEHFTLDEDDLLEKVYEVVENSKWLNNVPVILPLPENNKLGIMIKSDYTTDYINSLIVQLITMQSPLSLKIVVFTSEENKSNWEYLKYVPHCWSDDKETRFFATSLEEMQEISSFLEKEYKQRQSHKTGIEDSNNTSVNADQEQHIHGDLYKNFETYYILIDDNYQMSKYTVITDVLLKTATNYGFSYICIGQELKDFSNDCTTFLDINNKNGNILKKNINIKDILTFNNEYMANMALRDACRKLANVPITTKDGLSVLPSSLAFLEMLDASKIDHLNILNRWKTNNPVISLAVPVGVHTNGEKFKLDLHEKFHGPHGLVAGMTGSGKSEFIITYILSMIVNFHPYEVQFVLIDYKGGGLAGAFENKETGVRIPHLVGTITNLDTSEMNRTLVSIQSELQRRQRKFNEVRDRLGESTIDIYKYQRLYREGAIDEPMSHLFIISDEFAELKAQQPEFMSQLISIARIGRSLGVHLILATQKPSGVVNEQIWSNSKFKVCLKVQDRSDSMEMLKKPDAANIKETGRFFLQVGYDDYFDIGQSGWSGAKYVPSDNIIKKKDDTINFVNNIGVHIKSIKEMVKEDSSVNYGDQLTNVVKTIYNLGEQEHLVTSKLWLDAIPGQIYVQNLKNKYNYKPTPYQITPVIGEYDMPAAQQQHLLTLDLTNKINTLIYGQAGSGKENLLSTIIGSTCLEHTPEEVNFYILDFGTEALKMFVNVPHVGDIATIETPEKVEDTFRMLYDEMDRRKELFVNYSGSYNDYLANSGEKLPLIVVIINNYEVFAENYSKLSEGVMNIYRDAGKYGIVFIVTVISSNGIRSRLIQYFNNKICLQMPNETDYRTLLNSPKGLFPAKHFGRGIIAMNDTAYEFQTAMLLDKNELSNFVRNMSEQMNEAYTVRAKRIPTLPSVVTVDLFENNENSLSRMPIGYEMNSKEPFYYDFEVPKFVPVLSTDMSDYKMSFVYSIIKLFSKVQNINTVVVDLVGAFDKDYDVTCYKENIDESIVEIYNNIKQAKENDPTTYYIFLGIGQIQKILSPKSVELLNKLFMEISDTTPARFMLVDTYVSFKRIQSDAWYQSSVDTGYGIWLGEDVGTQMTINFNNLSLEEKKMYFPYMGFAVKNGKHKVIKHMVEKMEENDEE